MTALEKTDQLAPKQASEKAPPLSISLIDKKKACSSCKKWFKEEGFSKRQWGTSEMQRKCKTCVDSAVAAIEASQAKLTADQLAPPSLQQASGTAQSLKRSVTDQSKACSSCEKCFKEDGFSKRQWGAAGGTQRKCKTCVDSAVADIEANQSKKASCSMCGESLPWDSFSKRQLTVVKDGERKCDGCAAKVLKEKEAGHAKAHTREKRHEARPADRARNSSTVNKFSDNSQKKKESEKLSEVSVGEEVKGVENAYEEKDQGLKGMMGEGLNSPKESDSPSRDGPPQAAGVEKQVPAASRSIAAPAPNVVIPERPQGLAMLKDCSSCGEGLTIESFSKRQWAQPAEVRKCRPCVTKFVEVLSAMQREATLACKRAQCGKGAEWQTDGVLKLPNENMESVEKGKLGDGSQAIGEDVKSNLPSQDAVEQQGRDFKPWKVNEELFDELIVRNQSTGKDLKIQPMSRVVEETNANGRTHRENESRSEEAVGDAPKLSRDNGVSVDVIALGDESQAAVESEPASPGIEEADADERQHCGEASRVEGMVDVAPASPKENEGPIDNYLSGHGSQAANEGVESESASWSAEGANADERLLCEVGVPSKENDGCIGKNISGDDSQAAEESAK